MWIVLPHARPQDSCRSVVRHVTDPSACGRDEHPSRTRAVPHAQPQPHPVTPHHPFLLHPALLAVSSFCGRFKVTVNQATLWWERERWGRYLFFTVPSNIVIMETVEAIQNRQFCSSTIDPGNHPENPDLVLNRQTPIKIYLNYVFLKTPILDLLLFLPSSLSQLHPHWTWPQRSPNFHLGLSLLRYLHTSFCK